MAGTGIQTTLRASELGNEIRHLAVSDDGRTAGLISGDLLAVLAVS